jgi:hypothetical protein
VEDGAHAMCAAPDFTSLDAAHLVKAACKSNSAASAQTAAVQREGFSCLSNSCAHLANQSHINSICDCLEKLA